MHEAIQLMMSQHERPPKAAAATKDHHENNNNQQGSNSGSKKSGNNTTRPQEQSLKCPRCDSPNTKFCYYNNYSLTQPRHFCKTCRRYWTKGGALRNVPIGGGCRKNKKVKSSRHYSCDSKDCGDGTNSSLEHHHHLGGGLKFLHSLSSPPIHDFQLGGLTLPFLHHPPIPTTNSIYNNNHFSSFGDGSVTNAPNFNLDHSCGTTTPSSSNLLGLNYPFNGENAANAIQGMCSMNIHNPNLASSIESLSSINQDLHWKLQQQRLNMLFGGDNQKDGSNLEISQTQRPHPILFQNLEISNPETFPIGASRKEGSSGGGGGDDIPTEWFFGNSYTSVTTKTATPTTSGGGHGNENDNGNNWNGNVHAWGDVNVQHQQYSSLP